MKTFEDKTNLTGVSLMCEKTCKYDLGFADWCAMHGYATHNFGATTKSLGKELSKSVAKISNQVWVWSYKTNEYTLWMYKENSNGNVKATSN